MSLYMGKIGRAIIKHAIKSPLLNRAITRSINIANRVFDDQFVPGLTRETFKLSQEIKPGEQIEIRSDGFYREDKKLADNPLGSYYGSPETIAWQSTSPETLVRYFSEKKYIIEFKGMEIWGNSRFIKKTQKALSLLSKTNAFEIISPYLKIISQVKRGSGIDLFSPKPTFSIGELSWRGADLKFYASIIAHDGYHSLLYSEASRETGELYPPPESYSGFDAERKCCLFQLAALRDMKGFLFDILYLKLLIRFPYYYLVPYNRRWW